MKIPELYRDYLAKPNETLYEHTQNLLDKLQELDMVADLSNKKIRKLVELSCILHDAGKINPKFQQRLITHSKFDEKNEVGHNILSAFLASEFISKMNLDFEISDGELDVVIHAILNHHHFEDNYEALSEKEAIIKENLKLICEKVLLVQKDLHESITLRKRKDLKDKRNEPPPEFVLVKGFLHKCDYTASAHSDIEIPNNDLEERLESWKSIRNAQWNDMQTFAKNNSDKNIVLVGSTGLGKTEASLLWIGNNKGFYVLPLKTAINAMYERLKKDFYENDFEKYLALLHSDTKNIYIISDKNKNDTDSFWKYFDLTKSFAMPLTVCTPDQIFKFAFKYPSYEIILATCSYSKVVIDEIQAYSPDILATLIYGLHKIVEVGGKFAITTATFPPFIRDLLCKNPLVQTTEKSFINNHVRHNVVLNDKERLSSEFIREFINSNFEEESLKVLVVLNTVEEARILYKELRDLPIEVKLLHAKFILKDRKEKEFEIMSDGKTECKKHIVWIATQIVEASLDIDFDYLFTELSDLSGLFQRMGRVNRKGKKSSEKNNIYIFTQINNDLLKKEKSSMIYNSLYQLGRDALFDWANKNSAGKMTELEKMDMIESYYTSEKIREKEKENQYASYLRDYNSKYEYLERISPEELKINEVQQEFRNINSIKIIPKPVYNKNLVEINSIIDVINEKKKNLKNVSVEEYKKIKLEILKLKEEINLYTMSTEYFRITKTIDTINVENEDIRILECAYSSEIGIDFDADQKSEEAIIW